MSRTGESTAEQLTFLYEARAAVSVLEASVELGLLRRLGDGLTDPATLARECGIDEHAVAALLPVLTRLGLAVTDGRGAYRAGQGAEAGFLDLLGAWNGLADSLRGAGRARSDLQQVYPRVVDSLATLFAPAAAAASEHLAGCRHVLDIGAGAAPWSIALADRDPACHITATDLDTVIGVTRRAVSSAGCDGQFRFVDGDVFEVELDRRAYDLVIVGNLCHLFDERANARLFRRVAGWLAPGGTVAVIDFLTSERGDDPRTIMLYGLGLRHRTDGGGLYPMSTYVGWLRDAGLQGIERRELSPHPPLSLISASDGRPTGFVSGRAAGAGAP